MRHLLDIDDLTPTELRQICELATATDASAPQVLKGKGVAAIFEKPACRTRNSTEMAIVELGGHPVSIAKDEVGIDTRESAEDVTRTLACFHAAICARVFTHSVLERMAACEVAPIVNLLSDVAHPLQAIADVLTIQSELGSVQNKTVAYIGDINNVAVSLAFAVGYMGGTIRFGSPPKYGLKPADERRLSAVGVTPEQFDDPIAAVAGADVVYTDTWVSMGQEAQRQKRLDDFAGFCVDEALLGNAPEAIFMHCLPAHRDEEVSAAVLDGPQSRIWKQAKNRRDAIRAVFIWLMNQPASN